MKVYTNNKQNKYIRCVRYGMFKPNCDAIYKELSNSINHFYSIHHLTQLKHVKPQLMLVKNNLARK